MDVQLVRDLAVVDPCQNKANQKLRMDTYLETTKDIYKKAAETPDVGLCCTTTPIWAFPGLDIPKKMQVKQGGRYIAVQIFL